MSRKVISLFEDYGYSFKYVDRRFLIEDTEINGMKLPSGHLDIIWEKEKMPISLGNLNGKKYYSVVEETSMEILLEGILNKDISEENYDITIENDLNSKFTSEILQMNGEHLNKYTEDKEYLTYLGLPLLLDETNDDTETLSAEEL
jgi:hypothetical protein